MSVLIKGLKMPQSCFDCDALELSGAIGCKHAYALSNSVCGRALNCPLVELSDHGDLIDRDDLRKQIPSEEMVSKFAIENAYVVIPTERSEDE